MARERGVFSNVNKSVYADWNNAWQPRNAAITSIAPTGSISMLLDVNSGIEPYFKLAYTKSIRAGQFTYVAPELKKALEKRYDKVDVEEITKSSC